MISLLFLCKLQDNMVPKSMQQGEQMVGRTSIPREMKYLPGIPIGLGQDLDLYRSVWNSEAI